MTMKYTIAYLLGMFPTVIQQFSVHELPFILFSQQKLGNISWSDKMTLPKSPNEFPWWAGIPTLNPSPNPMSLL